MRSLARLYFDHFSHLPRVGVGADDRGSPVDLTSLGLCGPVDLTDLSPHCIHPVDLTSLGLCGPVDLTNPEPHCIDPVDLTSLGLCGPVDLTILVRIA